MRARAIGLEGKNLLIVPLRESCTGWFEGYKPETDAELLSALPPDEGDEEWVW